MGPGLCIFNKCLSASDAAIHAPHRSLGEAGAGCLPTVDCRGFEMFLKKEGVGEEEERRVGSPGWGLWPVRESPQRAGGALCR